MDLADLTGKTMLDCVVRASERVRCSQLSIWIEFWVRYQFPAFLMSRKAFEFHS